MTSMIIQRDLVVSLKKETLLNVGVLSKLQPISSDLSRLLKDNQLEKPTQNVFNHLAHYLVNIIDPQVSFSWPLYDTKIERMYRNELSEFIADYSSKGLLSPVMSSYLVNPGCYKVVLLMFQLSQLAVQRVLLMKMKSDSQMKLYNEMTEKYKSRKEDGFIETIEKETRFVSSKFSNYLMKREATETIASKLRDHIIKMEDKIKSYKAQELINNLVDGYLKKSELDEESKTEILEIKNVKKPAKYFDKCLSAFDEEITKMEAKWESKTAPLLKISQTTYQNTETLISRQTGEADQKTFTIEYNPSTNILCTAELEKQVNTEEKYILKNIIRDNRLSFPNLIRGFLISICFILKDTKIGDEIYQFNKYLEGGRRNYTDVVNTMRAIAERIVKVEDKLQRSQDSFSSTRSSVKISEIPPLPDLSNLKMNQNFNVHSQKYFTALNPVHFTKHQFNFHRQKIESQTLPMVYGSLLKKPREDFEKILSACRINAYDDMNITQNNLNVTAMSQVRNETIAECTTGFTKQQIRRLLSTNKKSSSKKFQQSGHKPNHKIVKASLFNESNWSNESERISRSHSSPNLYENRDQKSMNILRRKLMTMKDSPSLLEMSGIAAIGRDSNQSTPQGMLESTRQFDVTSLPSLSNNVTPKSDVSDNIDEFNRDCEFKAPLVLPQRRHKTLTDEVFKQRKSKLPQPTSRKTFDSHQNRVIPQIICEELMPQRDCEVVNEEVLPKPKTQEHEETVLPQRKSTEFSENKSETPKVNPVIIKKTSSLEKIINRFKKVRASVLPMDFKDENDIKTIFEDKENHNNTHNILTTNIGDGLTANKNLLPDLLSPSCSIIQGSTKDILMALKFDSDEEEKVDKPRRPRESLGTALGVDHTFLDQFDLID